MTAPEAIRRMFPDKTNEELSGMWAKLFIPKMSAEIGKPFIHPVILDDYLIAEYGQYETSLGEFITSKFGDEVLEAVK